MNILRSAVDRCRVQDVRTPGVYDALTFLKGCSAVKRPFDQFRSAMQSRFMTRQDKEALGQALNASLNEIRRCLAEADEEVWKIYLASPTGFELETVNYDDLSEEPEVIDILKLKEVGK